ncbi:MAG: PASTA domain-containing protein [Solirubrobacteraceae bacterium]
MRRVGGMVMASVVLSAGVGAGSPVAGGWSPTVVVPAVTGDVIAGYRRLHRVGLRMAIPSSFSVRALCRLAARAQSPAAGTRVGAGAVVTLRRLGCAVASPAGTYVRVTVPDLRGRPASAAVAWAERAGLYWEVVRLAALRPSSRGELLDNYVVVGQSPAAGATLGRGFDCSTSATRCYRVTPLVLRARRVWG